MGKRIGPCICIAHVCPDRIVHRFSFLCIWIGMHVYVTNVYNILKCVYEWISHIVTPIHLCIDVWTCVILIFLCERIAHIYVYTHMFYDLANRGDLGRCFHKYPKLNGALNIICQCEKFFHMSYLNELLSMTFELTIWGLSPISLCFIKKCNYGFSINVTELIIEWTRCSGGTFHRREGRVYHSPHGVDSMISQQGKLVIFTRRPQIAINYACNIRSSKWYHLICQFKVNILLCLSREPLLGVSLYNNKFHVYHPCS